MKNTLFVFTILFFPTITSAHGIGEVYALPVPLNYYLLGAGLAVAVSFFLVAFFMNKEETIESENRKIINVNWLPHFLRICKVISIGFLVLMIATGILGNQDPTQNFAPVFFWIYFLIGIGILSLFIGNIWDKLNPWKTLVSKIQLNNQTRVLSGTVGLVLLFALFWWELVSGFSFQPIFVGGILLLYTMYNFIFALYFKNWFKVGEVFSVLYNFIGNLAHFRISDDNNSIEVVNKRSMLSGEIQPWWMLGVACVLLAGASFDSISESAIWEQGLRAIGLSPFAQLPATFGLFFSGVFYLATYLLVVWLMKKITNIQSTVKTLSLQFSLSLIPIAFGYVLAHNFSLIVVMAWRLIGILSDPFGFGWNLFGTANYIQKELILGAKTVWFTEISFIILAHIVGVIYAHMLAKAIFKENNVALKSQLPMIILMIGYTVIALWLISLPLVIQG